LIKVKNENELLKNKILRNDRRFTDYKNKEINHENVQDLNNEIENLQKENLTLKENNKKLTSQLEDSQKQKEENEGFKQLITKLQSEKENSDEVINNLKRENEKIKNQIVRLSQKLPEEFNDLQKQYNELESKYLQQMKNKSNKSTPNKPKKSQSEIENNEEKLANELKEAKKEIEIIKKKNLELVSQLEEKEIRKNCYDNKSEGGNMSNYEEEFDLRKMAKGAKDKNRSQDINIDYPGVQTIKEKYRELDFYYNSLEGLVKKLLLTIQCNPKNKTYVAELCRIVGFDLETTNKILNNKNKKLILGLFSK
jgi:chromosome segregation ATPase